jgi:hypothetical protein
MMEVVGPWQLKSWGQAQAGNRASKTGCYLLWRDINPECNAGISHGQQLRDSTFFSFFALLVAEAR